MTRRNQDNNSQRRPFVVMLVFLALLAIALNLSQQSIDRFFVGSKEVHDLLETAYKIQKYDAILTTEAKLYAIDSDESHQTIYNDTLLLLEDEFEKVVQFDPAFQTYINQIDEANIHLVDLEIQAFELSANRKNTEAIQILLSEQYSAYKEMYALPLNELLNDINAAHINRYNQLESTLNFNLILIFSIFILIIAFLILVYITLERRMRFEQKLTEISHRLLSTEETIDSVFEYTLNEIKNFYKLDYVLLINHRENKQDYYTSSLLKSDHILIKIFKKNYEHFQVIIKRLKDVAVIVF